MNWHVYKIPPIDIGWELIQGVGDVAGQIARDTLIEDINTTGHGDFADNFQKAKEVAQKAGWEGKYRENPRTFWIPTEDSFSYGFVWKQPNNGTTFVISPIPLPWLSAFSS